MLLTNLINSLKKPTIDLNLPDNYLTSLLNVEDRKPEFTRESLYSGYVHVSSLSGDLCPRRYAIMHKDNLSTTESLTGGHRVTFAIGRFVEQYVRAGLITSLGASKIYAQWVKPDGTKYVGFNTALNGETHKFEEIDLIDTEYNIKGHPDMIFKFGDKLKVLEIKSMAKEKWNALEAPLPEHLVQAGMYPRIMAKMGLPVSDEVTFLYVSKEFKFGSPYKEFHVKTSDLDSLILPAYEDAKALKKFWDNGTLPVRTCQEVTQRRAKACYVQGRCFFENP